jgi:hypothetical protein
MRPIRSLILIAGAILALTAVAPTASAATLHPLHLTKDCSTFTGEIPSLCRIAVSNVKIIPVGTKIWYKGPVVSNAYFLSSNVVMDVGHASTATGYCIFDTEAGASPGMCAFWRGKGTLAGFHAIIHVTIDSKHLWHWDGSYYFATT